jgi:Zn-dependent M28 family amino/carboxypeptidase
MAHCEFKTKSKTIEGREKMKHKIFAVLSIFALLGSMLVAVASADVPTDTSALLEAVTLEGIVEHLEDLEAIGPHASGTPGYDEAVDYVAGQLLAAGYQVTVQPFDFTFFEELTPAVLDQVAPNTVPYTYDEDYYTMDYSGSGDVTAGVQAVDLLLPPTGGSTSGCDGAYTEVGPGGYGYIVPDPSGPDDFAGFTAGNIALIQRGTCTYALKATNAQAAGAVGVIIFNEGNTSGRIPLMYGTLGGPGPTIPVVSASHTLGVALSELIDDGLVLHLKTETVSEIRSTSNVLAETQGGRDDRVVVVGAHLDTEPVGPGSNDNGSGVATILEIAQQMQELGIEPRNKVVFAFWGAEEAGLLGAEYYVYSLTKRERKNIALNLNFDMLASHNYALFVYDGDGSATPWAGPTGSANIEDIFLDYFASQGLATWPTAFDGRSDYGPFIEVGIPAGGLFSGGDDTKTEEQAAIYGGTAGEDYDPYYHTADDTFENINEASLDYMSDAVAHAVLTFAMTKAAVPGTAKASTKAMEAMEFKGSKTQR